MGNTASCLIYFHGFVSLSVTSQGKFRMIAFGSLGCKKRVGQHMGSRESQQSLSLTDCKQSGRTRDERTQSFEQLSACGWIPRENSILNLAKVVNRDRLDSGSLFTHRATNSLDVCEWLTYTPINTAVKPSDRKSTRLNSSHSEISRMPSSA